jgi:hypothetical protein
VRDRRRNAVAIRIRQEIRKRLSALLPRRSWRNEQSIRPLLGQHAAKLDSAGAADLLRRLTASRWPREPDARSAGLVDEGVLLAEVDQILRGDWIVFDRRVQVGRNGPDWRAHPLSGRRTPLAHFSRLAFHGEHVGGDIKYLWEINRHAELVRLAQGYCLTASDEMASSAVAMLERWWDENPCGYGLNWVSALEVAFRLVAWSFVWQYTRGSEVWTDTRVRRLLFEVDASCRYVLSYDSVHHSPNTHLTGEAMGVLYATSLFRELRVATAARRWAIDTLQSEVPHQFLRDGMHFERSTGYHRYHTEFYLHATAIAAHDGEQWDRVWHPALRSALHATSALRRPDGKWPVIGDEDGGAMIKLWTGDARDQGHLLSVGAKLLAEPTWRRGLEPRHDALSWWLSAPSRAAVGLPTVPIETTKPPLRAIHLPDAGYFGAVSDDGWYMLVDAGPHGGDRTGHAHTDVGHVEVCVDEQPILSDPGCAVYTADRDRRDWYRSLCAHASVVVDGDGLAVPDGAFGWASVAPTPVAELISLDSAIAVRLRYSSSEGRWTHERVSVLLRGRGVIVVDQIIGGPVGRVQWHWPVALRERPSMSSADVLDVGPVSLMWAATRPLQVDVPATRSSTSYGIEHPGHGLRMTAVPTEDSVTSVLAITGRGYVVPQLVVLPDRVLATFPGSKEGSTTVLEVRPGTVPAVVITDSGDR